MMRHLCAITALLSLVACASGQVRGPSPALLGRMYEADALVERGCYLCLDEALQIYENLTVAPTPPPGVRRKAFYTALLLELRARELGVVGAAHLTRARDIFQTLPPSAAHSVYLDAVDATPWNVQSVSEEFRASFIERNRTVVSQQFPAWSTLLRETATENVMAAYLFATLACAYRQFADRPLDFTDLLEAHPHSRLLAYKAATCPRRKADLLADILAVDRDFDEIHYWLGLEALGRQQLREAEAYLLQAYTAIPSWPAAILSLASVYLAFEEPDKSLALYEHALRLESHDRQALLGKAKALSYLDRSADAIQTLDELLGIGTPSLGDAHYWRAWNLYRLEEVDAAWEDVEKAKKYRYDSEVFKLAGIIALQRKQLQEAQQNFETAVERSAADCDARFYLARVHVERANWEPTGPTFATAADCYENRGEQLQAQIQETERSELSEERKRVSVANRQAELETANRRWAASIYNAALGYFNTQLKPEALRYAEQARGLGDYTTRAEQLLTKIRQLP